MLDIGKNLSQLSEELKKQAGFDVKDQIVDVVKGISGVTITVEDVFVKDSVYKIKVSGSKKIKILLYKQAIEERIREQVKLTTLVL